MGYLSCWKRNPLPPAGIIPVFPVVLSGRSTSDGTFWGHNSINFDNKYNFKYPKNQRSYSACIPVFPWDGLGTCPVLYAKSAKTGTASCDYLMTVTRCWWKKCFSEEWKSTESSICSPHAVLQLILSSAVQIHKALTKYCSLRSARHLIIFLLNWASLFWWSLSTWFHIFVPSCSVRMSSHHT